MMYYNLFINSFAYFGTGIVCYNISSHVEFSGV